MKVLLGGRERALVKAKDICRMATIGSNGWLHVVPVSYVYLNGKFYIPTSRGTRKVRNLVRKSKATIVVDDERSEQGVMIECTSKFLGRWKARTKLNHMRKVKHWTSNESTAVIELDPVRESSWFLKS